MWNELSNINSTHIQQFQRKPFQDIANSMNLISD